MTTVRIPPTLRAEVGGERQVEASGSTMREVLDDLAGRYPGLGAQLLVDGDIAPFVNVYLNNEDVRTMDGLETRVADGSTAPNEARMPSPRNLSILPPFAAISGHSRP